MGFALTAGLGAWGRLNVTSFTVQTIDMLWVLVCAALIFRFAGTPQRQIGARIWVNPLAAYSVNNFWLALAIAPVLGIIFNDAPFNSISSALRFFQYFTFPLLLHGL